MRNLSNGRLGYPVVCPSFEPYWGEPMGQAIIPEFQSDQEVDQIAKLIADLPKRGRYAITLRYRDRFSGREGARAMRCPKGSFWRYLRNAEKKLDLAMRGH